MHLSDRARRRMSDDNYYTELENYLFNMYKNTQFDIGLERPPNFSKTVMKFNRQFDKRYKVVKVDFVNKKYD